MENAVEENIKNYYGYTFYRDGKIISPDGNELVGYHFTYPYSHININHDGKTEKKLKAKLVYELFSGEKVSRKFIIRFRDNNSKNCAFDNLYLESRSDFFKAHPNGKTRKFSESTRKEIRNTYYTEANKKRANAPSLRELSVMYSCSLSTIQKILSE